MIKKIPIAATPIHLKEIVFSLRSLFEKGASRRQLKEFCLSFINKKYLFFLNSGLAGFFVILEALRGILEKKELILPAYTAGSLIVAIKKAGLKPVLCDISLDDFNMDYGKLEDVISQNTLAVLGVHMFGIVDRGLEEFKKRHPDIFTIEDCAQGLGSKINHQSVGNLGDLSFFSFNRGKNIPTYGGGYIATDSEKLVEKLEEVIGGRRLTRCSIAEKAIVVLKNFMLLVAVKPQVYGTLYSLISCFKDKAPPQDFEVKEYTDFQAGVALSLMKEIDRLSKMRYENGMKLIQGLKGIEGIITPKISPNTEPAFNRLPIIFKDAKKIEKIEKELWQAGIETSRMYLKPLHHMFDLGYQKGDFPRAIYLANHLLTLPVHPLVRDKDIVRMIEAIRA